MTKQDAAHAARAFGLALLAAFFVAAMSPASAQWEGTYGMSSPGPSGRDGFWGWGAPQPQYRAAPTRAQPATRPLAYANPSASPSPGWRLPFFSRANEVKAPPPAPTTAFCVRLCDGRFFPLTQPSAQMTPAKLCSALCPASKTKVFEGATIDEAATTDGALYTKLSTAFLFRKELVAGCTCNGKTALGLAKIDIAADPTLQTGDVVATAHGLKVFNGAPGVRHKAASFTPLKKSAVPADLRRTLRGLRVAKN